MAPKEEEKNAGFYWHILMQKSIMEPYDERKMNDKNEQMNISYFFRCLEKYPLYIVNFMNIWEFWMLQ